MTFQFDHAVREQLRLQIESYGSDPRKLNDEERAQFISWNVLALTDELHEALAEVGWKPWATSRHLNRDAFKSELADAFHFFMNLMLAGDISADEMLDEYRRKRQKNAQRQIDGYDGISTKCPKCKRALDDDAVLCTVEHTDLVINDEVQESYITGGTCEKEGEWTA